MQVERPLGLLEKFQTSKYFVNCYGAATFTALLRHPPRPPITTDQQINKNDAIKRFYLNHLHTPLSHLVKKHPQLSLVVAHWNQPTIHFARLAKFDLSAILHIDTSNTPFWDRITLSEIIANECDHDFDFDNHTIPLWYLRIYVHDDRLDECSMTLTVNHVVMDGASVATFWRELYTELNSNSHNHSKSQIKEDNNQIKSVENDYTLRSNLESSLLGPYEDRQGPMPSQWEVMQLIMRKTVKSILPISLAQYWFPTVGWAGDIRGVTDKTLARHHTQTRAIEINGTQWHNVSIMAAMITAFSKLYGDQENKVVTHTPINCRSFCKEPPVPQDEMGNFVGNYAHTWGPSYITLKNNDYGDNNKRLASLFWDKAKHYYENLKINKLQGAKDPGKWLAVPRFPEDYIQTWYNNWNANSMARSGGIQLSDLGRFIYVSDDNNQKESYNGNANIKNNPWEIQSIWFSQSSQMMTMALSVTSISTKDSMYATVTWQKGALDESKIEQFGPLVIDALETSYQ
ncbi:hypothetical protein BDC45DRAFT_518248 [Circinella umbellata]|nr:hypothetical protein BDC45DRAFT_518248 [Circinella umbellata]